MKKGYLEKEAVRYEIQTAKTLIVLFVIAVVFGPLLIYAARYIEERAPLVVLVIQIGIAVGILVVFIPIGIFIYRIIKQVIRPKLYSNLRVNFEQANKNEAGQTIDAEAEQGRILMEQYIYVSAGTKVKKTRRKIVLLPSFLLLPVEAGDYMAIPTDKIYWTCIHVSGRESQLMCKLRIFYDRKIHDMDYVEFLHAYHIVAAIHQHIPNVFYAYNPFIFSYELEHLFYNDYYAFVDTYNRHKEAYLKSAEEHNGVK